MSNNFANLPETQQGALSFFQELPSEQNKEVIEILLSPEAFEKLLTSLKTNS